MTTSASPPEACGTTSSGAGGPTSSPCSTPTPGSPTCPRPTSRGGRRRAHGGGGRPAGRVGPAAGPPRGHGGDRAPPRASPPPWSWRCRPTIPPPTGTVLVYGHYDKQPPFEGWSEGRGPWSPGARRTTGSTPGAWPTTGTRCLRPSWPSKRWRRPVGGTAGASSSPRAPRRAAAPTCPPCSAHLSDRIGAPDLVVALDSGSPTYDRLWITTSLRGAIVGTLTVRVLEQGVHSGSAGAVVPSSFRLARLLLDRIEDPAHRGPASCPSSGRSSAGGARGGRVHGRGAGRPGSRTPSRSRCRGPRPPGCRTPPTGPCARPGRARWRSSVRTGSRPARRPAPCSAPSPP